MFKAVLARGDDHFYLFGGEAADWLESTVRVHTVDALTLDEWVEQFKKLREGNRQLMGRAGKKPKSRSGT